MNSNGEITSLPNKAYEDALKEIIETNLKGSSDKFKIVYSAGSNKGDNYMGVIYRIQVYDKNENEPKLNLILKATAGNETRRVEMLVPEFFGNEIEYYEKVFPLYRKFQVEKGIDVLKDGFYHHAKCYKCITEEPNEGLFFEDLKAQGFALFDRMKDLTKEHVLIAMKVLARMHAIFYSIKDQKPELVETFFKRKDIFELWVDRGNFDAFYEGAKKQAHEAIDKLKDLEMKKKVEKFLNRSLQDIMHYCFNNKNFEPYGILCHGDCWNNNMMFRNDKNGDPNDVRLMDFQLLRYASPACDLTYYIFACTTKTLRDLYYDEFLDTYYQELSSFITRLGSDPAKVYPLEVFNSHLKKFAQFGLTMSVMFLPFFTASADDAPDMDVLAENLKKINDSAEIDNNAFKITKDVAFDAYAERMQGIFKNMYDLGYI